MDAIFGKRRRFWLFFAAEWLLVAGLALLWFVTRPHRDARPDQAAANDVRKPNDLQKPSEPDRSATLEPEATAELAASAPLKLRGERSPGELAERKPVQGPALKKDTRSDAARQALAPDKTAARAKKPKHRPSLPARPVAVDGSAAPPQPPMGVTAPNAAAAVSIAEQPLPQPIRPIIRPLVSPLPHGVSVNPDGLVSVEFERLKPGLERTDAFRPVASGPRRYITGRHIYTVSQDLLHDGSPAVNESASYSMSAADDGDPSGDQALSGGVALSIHNRGTVTGVTDLPVPQRGFLAPSHSVHAVSDGTADAIATAIQNVREHPEQFFARPRMDSLGGMGAFGFNFGPTRPRCHPRHRSVPWGSYNRSPYDFGYASPSGNGAPCLTPACLAGVSEDARLTSVSLDYQGKSTPVEVVGDLEGARDDLAAWSATGDDQRIRDALLSVYDEEIGLWQAVAASSATAKAAQQAWASGDAANCLALCQQYETQIDPYREGRQFDLFARDEQAVQQLTSQASARARTTAPVATIATPASNGASAGR